MELKPCPFCGEIPFEVDNFGEGTLAMCRTERCPMYADTPDPSTWNTRPIEDAKDAEIASLNREGDALAVMWREIVAKRDAEIARLKAEVERLEAEARRREGRA